MELQELNKVRKFRILTTTSHNKGGRFRNNFKGTYAQVIEKCSHNNLSEKKKEWLLWEEVEDT